MTIRSLPTSAFRSFPIRRNDASHGCRAYRSGIRRRHSVPGRRILSGTRNPVISTMPEVSTVKQEQMTCEEDWPVGKKAAFFTLTVWLGAPLGLMIGAFIADTGGGGMPSELSPSPA